MTDKTDALIEQVEQMVGMGHEAWDTINPREIAAAFREALAAPAAGAAGQGEVVAVVGERGNVSWRSERILPVGTPLYAASGVAVVPEGWALTRLRAHEARCAACSRAVWDGKDSTNRVGFLAPCGKSVARRGDCGTADCADTLAQPRAERQEDQP